MTCYHDFILITYYLSCLLTESVDNLIQYITPNLGLEEYFYYYHDFILITHYLILSCLLTESGDNIIVFNT